VDVAGYLKRCREAPDEKPFAWERGCNKKGLDSEPAFLIAKQTQESKPNANRLAGCVSRAYEGMKSHREIAGGLPDATAI